MRTLTSFIVPGIQQVCTKASKPSMMSSGDGQLGWQYTIGRDSSYIFHHCAIFLVLGATYQTLFYGLNDNSLKARGGILICFSCTCALIQSSALHILPNWVAASETFCQLVLHFCRRFVVLSILFTIEILTIWVIFGQSVFQHDYSRLLLLFFWLSLTLSLVVHVALVELPRIHKQADEREQDSMLEQCEDEECEMVTEIPTETDRLLTGKGCVKEDVPVHSSWFYQFYYDLLSLQTALEALVITCLFVIAFHSFHSLKLLWPVCKTVLISSRPEWAIPLATGVVISLAILFILAVSCNRNKI
jgi:hypothetical protein